MHHKKIILTFFRRIQLAFLFFYDKDGRLKRQSLIYKKSHPREKKNTAKAKTSRKKARTSK